MQNFVVTGCSNGLGLAICQELKKAAGKAVIGIDCVLAPFPFDWFVECDLSKPEEIQETASLIRAHWQVDCLINCAGINEINLLEDLALENWERVISINARAIYLLSQGLLQPLIASKGTILNIISNASHMPMTASLAYNASKGAAHIMTLQLARELTRRFGITVFGISPNKMAGTVMSSYIESRVPEVRGWTRERADAYQRQSLLTGEETQPEVVAEFITYLLSSKRNHQQLSGCVIPYGV